MRLVDRHFRELKVGDAPKVAPVDKLSLRPLVVVVAVTSLGARPFA